MAKWYGSYLRGENTYQETLVFPGAFRLLAPKQGGKYLDLACGEGMFAAAIAAEGAEILGIDIAPALIRAAKQKRISGADFLVADLQKPVSGIPEGVFDGSVCLLALQNIRDAAPVFRLAWQALKPGGRFVVVLNHPCFRIPRQSEWGFDEAKKTQYRRIDRYLSPMDIPIQMRPGETAGPRTMSFHRPLSWYMEIASAAGFFLQGLEEWVSDRESNAGGRSRAENRSRAEIPLFLAMSFKKG